MRIILIPLFALATLASCGGGSDNTQDQTAGTVTVSVFKSNDTAQCTGGGVSLAALEGQLNAAGVTASAKSCGNNGLVYATVCGAPDGKIGIFDIPATQVQAASAAGFGLLSTLPNASKTGC